MGLKKYHAKNQTGHLGTISTFTVFLLTCFTIRPKIVKLSFIFTAFKLKIDVLQALWLIFKHEKGRIVFLVTSIHHLVPSVVGLVIGFDFDSR